LEAVIILDEDVIQELKVMIAEVGSPRPLAAIYTNRDTVIISDRSWLAEWPIEFVRSCSQLAKLEYNIPDVFRRPEDLVTTPWTKLLFPDKSKYVDCDEADPTMEDLQTETLTYETDDGIRIKFSKYYVEMMFDICDEPTFQIYMLKENAGSLIVSEGGRRIGIVSPWVEE
jgi:hypothetical protein